MLQIRLLGEPEFWRGDERLQIRLRPRCLSLLGFLIARRDRRLSRTSIAMALWPDHAEDDARANLRRHLHLLTAALPKLDPPFFDDMQGGLQWNVDAPVRVDVIEFERLAAAPQSLAAAIGMYAGELLPGCSDEWIFDAREALRNRFIDTLLVLARDAMRRGEFDRVITLADRLLAEDEWREEAVRIKMQAVYRRGDRLGALAIFDRFSTSLQREMGVEPTLDTVALHTAILANVPLAAMDTDVEAASPLTPLAATALPFIGRETELSRMRAAWNRAARGHGSAVIVQGEAGIGKSRLTREIAMLAEAQGGCVLIGSTSNPQAEPYQAIVSALRRGLPFLAHAAVDDVWLATLATLLPEVYGLRPQLSAPEPLDPRFAEPRLTEAFARAFGAIARAKPLLLVLEDVQWAGDGTVSMLSALARRCAALPMLIVATFRTGDVDRGRFGPTRTALVQEHRAVVVSLDAMTGAEFRPISAADSTYADISSTVVSAAVVLGGGNPLFVTLLLQAYRESNTLPEDAKSIHTIGDAIALRLSALGERARTIAQAGAVIGPAFDAALVGQIGGWSDTEVYDALDALLDAGVIRETNASFEYTFTHALIERALYDTLDEPTRALRHRRIAAILDRSDDPRSAAVIARHWQRAGRQDEARAAYERAIDHALAVYAWSEAAAHAKAALSLCERDEDRLRILLAWMPALRGGDIATRSAHVDELEAVAARLDSPEARMETLLARSDVARHAGDREAQWHAADQLLMLADAVHSRKYRVHGLIALGMYQMDVADIAGCETTLREAVATARAGDVSINHEAAAVSQLGHALMRLGRLDEADAIVAERRPRYAAHLGELRYIVQLEAAVAIARNKLHDARTASREMLRIDLARGDITQETVSRAYLGSCSDAWPSEAREHFERAYEIASILERKTSMLMLRLNRGTLEEQTGRYDLALVCARDAFAIATELGEITVQAHALINESAALRETGDCEAASETARRAYTLVRDVDEPRVVAGALSAMGKAELARGNPSRAIELLEEAVMLRRRAHSQNTLVADLAALADALRQAGRPTDARRAADEVAPMVRDDLEEHLRPTKLCAVLADVYAANGDVERANEWRKRGRALIATTLGRISDEETRAAFRSLSYNRALLDEATVS